MSIYRITIATNLSVFGDGETYWTPDSTAPTAAKRVEELLRLRRTWMYANQEINGVRMSLESAKRNTQLARPPRVDFMDSGTFIDIPAKGVIDPGATNMNQSPIQNCLVSTLRFADTRSTRRYAAVVPRDSMAGQPYAFNRSGLFSAWWKGYDVFRGALVDSGWQIRAQILGSPVLEFRVIDFVLQAAAPSEVGVVIRTSGAPGFGVGDRIVLSKVRAAKGTRGSTMNGTWYIRSVDSTSSATQTIVYLRGSAGVDPESQRFTDKTLLRWVQYTTYPIQAYTPSFIRTHRRGKPSLATVGRRSTIRSLDP